MYIGKFLKKVINKNHKKTIYDIEIINKNHNTQKFVSFSSYVKLIRNKKRRIRR